MKATVAALFILFACTQASMPVLERKPVTDLGGSNCTDAIISAGGSLYNIYNDVMALIGGDFSKIEAIVGDFATIRDDVETIISACGLGMMVSIDATCQSDINTLVSTIQSIGSDISELVKGDIGVIEDIISKAQSLVSQLQTAVSDCL